ncbi:unnamed protein product [Durusdinium trenchii]|uniref:Mitochondrial carrier protein n=1 Tax=Durusdinium trenchii TaxID=1381693 RepID=A0ABP0T265_9DINO
MDVAGVPAAVAPVVGLSHFAPIQQGAIGALGSLPGTVCAHPLDVVKIRSLDARSHMATCSLLDAARGIFRDRGVRGFYRGLLPALEQRFLSRGPMFLVSEVSTQVVAERVPCTELQARACGSALSGYVVGCLQGVSEYRKKLLSQGVVLASEAGWGNICSQAWGAGLLRKGLLRRMHAAALCCSVFDSTFFCTRDFLTTYLAPPLAYGMAAATAVVVAYPLDTAVSRMLIVPPHKPVACMRRLAEVCFSIFFSGLQSGRRIERVLGCSRCVLGVYSRHRPLP